MHNGGVEIAWAHYREHGADVLAVGTALGLLDSANASARLTTTGSQIRHGERQFAHVLLRLLVARHCGLTLAAKPLVIDVSGKPALADPAFHVSLSHSDDLAVAAISDRAPIGVDCERVRDVSLNDARRRSIETAASALSSVQLLPLDPPERRFMQAWTRLEALGKATGEGIGSVLTRVGARKASAPASTPASNDQGLRVLDLVFLDGFVGSVASADIAIDVRAQPIPSSRQALDSWVQRPE